jgi:hypothetical protein
MGASDFSGAYHPSVTGRHILAPPWIAPSKEIALISTTAFEIKFGSDLSSSLMTEISIEFVPKGSY